MTYIAAKDAIRFKGRYLGNHRPMALQWLCDGSIEHPNRSKEK